MTLTFTALLLAHLVAEFLLRPPGRGPGAFALHVLAVFALSAAALGGAWPLALAVAAGHALIEGLSRALPATAQASLEDFALRQAAQITLRAAAAAALPGAFAAGLWADLPLLGPMILASGFLACTLAGGPAVGRLMTRFSHDLPEGLAGAGRLIGVLERGLIFLLVLIGEPAGIGFLIAAKSILRFDAAKDHRSAEYVIVGTLASFGWALIVTLATLHALEISGHRH